MGFAHFMGSLIGFVIALCILALVVGFFMAIVKSIAAARKVPVTIKTKTEPKPSFTGKQTSDPEYIVLPRGAMLEFLGSVVLPPWPDGKGGWLGGDVDCAPIASQITKWLDEHEITTPVSEEA